MNNTGYKRIRTVKAAKKHLKSEMCTLNPTKKLYKMIRWDSKKKSFLVESRFGQRSRIFEIFISTNNKV